MSISTFFIDDPKTANSFGLEIALKLKGSLALALKQKHGGFIIASSPNKTFCSGGNKKAYSKLKTKSEGVILNRKIRKIITDLSLAPILVVAAIEGDALGGGCELALSCDFIIASQKSRFSFRQVTQNLTPGWGGAIPLLRRVNPAVALDWLTSGRWIDSQEALEKGLIDQIIPNGEALSSAEQFIIDRTGPLVGTIKTLIKSGGVGEERTFEKLWWSKSHRARLN